LVQYVVDSSIGKLRARASPPWQLSGSVGI
jgi:hypothetical protein